MQNYQTLSVLKSRQLRTFSKWPGSSHGPAAAKSPVNLISLCTVKVIGGNLLRWVAARGFAIASLVHADRSGEDYFTQAAVKLTVSPCFKTGLPISGNIYLTFVASRTKGNRGYLSCMWQLERPAADCWALPEILKYIRVIHSVKASGDISMCGIWLSQRKPLVRIPVLENFLLVAWISNNYLASV